MDINGKDIEDSLLLCFNEHVNQRVWIESTLQSTGMI